MNLDVVIGSSLVMMMYVNATRSTMDDYESRILVYRWTCVSNTITHRLTAITEHMLALNSQGLHLHI